jgi:4-hydroxy-3-polyprenylbenzoate decarboxylase
MTYHTLRACLDDLERNGHLVRLADEVDAHLEAAEIHRRVFARGGPAILYANVRGCRFPMVSNLFGTMERARFIFRHTLDDARRLIELKADPGRLARSPLSSLRLASRALTMVPRRCRAGAVLANQTSIDHLPQLQCWPDDAGAFITLPVVYTEDVRRPGLLHSNLGMYRVQLSGGQYRRNEQVGLHYQIHRGIGVHHAAAIQSQKPFRVNIFVGGTPAMALAAVMPLPEGLAELTLAGVLAGHRIGMVVRPGRLPVYANADFCITGVVEPGRLLPEGPFGDHLGYYSLAHDFPVLRVEEVCHRQGAIWPFTVVGRPPQEDTVFGKLIHELTAPVISTIVPGLRAVHAVDAAGVHPLMLAIGSERYVPFQKITQPQEILTQANAILGQGQMSLAKYLLIVADDPEARLDVGDVAGFFRYLLERIDLTRDLHFQTCTTIDTLDYTGGRLNEGSKVVLAAAGPPRRRLGGESPREMGLPEGFSRPRVCLPGVMVIEGPEIAPDAKDGGQQTLRRFCESFSPSDPINEFPLLVLVDDSGFASASLENFLWVTFTRSNPAVDIDGIGAFTHEKHWGCHGSLAIDARRKPHHAPPLVVDASVTKRVDALAARRGPLSRWL